MGEFIRIAIRGQRFEQQGLPLAALDDLSAYQSLVYETARDLFFVDHPSRRRVPKGFASQLDLRLSRIESGSVVPLIERVEVDGGKLGIEPEDYFEAARDLISSTIEAARAGSDLPPRLSHRLLGYFDRFGRRLNEREWMELIPPGSTPGSEEAVVYNPQIRRRLATWYRDTYQQLVELTGAVSEIDRDSKTFRLRLPDGRVITCPYADPMLAELMEAFESEGTLPVQIVGIAVFDKSDRVLRFVEVDRAQAVREYAYVSQDSFEDRLSELRSLPAGWLDGYGDPLEADLVHSAHTVLMWLSEEGVAFPHMYPTPEGGVAAEWSIQEWEVMVEWQRAGEVEVVASDTESGDDRRQFFVGKDRALARQLKDFLGSLR